MEKTPKKYGYHEVYTRTIRTRNGRILHARDYGLKAFRIWVKD
jgi:hypothetical protein